MKHSIISCAWKKIHPIQLPYTTQNGRYNYFIFDRLVSHCIGCCQYKRPDIIVLTYSRYKCSRNNDSHSIKHIIQADWSSYVLRKMILSGSRMAQLYRWQSYRHIAVIYIVKLWRTAGVLYIGLPTLWSHSDAQCVINDAWWRTMTHSSIHIKKWQQNFPSQIFAF